MFGRSCTVILPSGSKFVLAADVKRLDQPFIWVGLITRVFMCIALPCRGGCDLAWVTVCVLKLNVILMVRPAARVNFFTLMSHFGVLSSAFYTPNASLCSPVFPDRYSKLARLFDDENSARCETSLLQGLAEIHVALKRLPRESGREARNLQAVLRLEHLRHLE